MLCSLFAPTEISVTTENHECSVHCLLCDRCQDGEPRVLRSLFAPTEIVVTMENHECSVRFCSDTDRCQDHKVSVHCLLCDRCHDGEPQGLCSLFAQ